MYTRVGMWLGILAVLLAAVGVFAFYLLGLIAAGPGRAGLGGVGTTLVVVIYILWLAAALLVILFQAALVLLAVDAARNLRKLVARSR